VSAWFTLPLLREQHAATFGPWQATVDAAQRAADRGWAAVVEPEVHVFSSYRWSVLRWRGQPTPPMLLSPRAPEPWTGVDRPWLVATVHPHLYWPSLTGSRTDYGGVSDRLRPLTQNRFLAAAVIDNPPLPVGRWWTVEQLPDGRPFMWAGAGAELWLPPSPAGTLVGLELRPAPGQLPLEVLVSHGGGRFVLGGRDPATRLWTRTTSDAADEPVVVELVRGAGYPPGGADERPLVVQLLDVRVQPRGSGWRGCAATPSERAGLGLELDGAYGPELFPELGRGVWLTPDASFRVAIDEPGQLTLWLAAPRPTATGVEVVVDGTVIAGPVALDHRPAGVEISVDGAAVGAGFLAFEIVSEPYQPSTFGGNDSRVLGVVLLGLEFVPARPSVGWWNDTARHRDPAWRSNAEVSE
jgi:hypothetical protein